jgi:hypothetical protein
MGGRGDVSSKPAKASGVTADADAPTPDDPKQGDIVLVNGREAVFLYRRGDAAIIRYFGEDDSRAVPFSKIRWRAP